MSPYYFEKVGVLLRVESNPGWRLIKAAALTLDLVSWGGRGSVAATDVYILHWMYSLFIWSNKKTLFICFVRPKGFQEPLTEQKSTGSAAYD